MCAAGVVQLLFQIPGFVRLSLLPRLNVRFKDGEVNRLLKKLLPATFGASVTQISVLFDTLFASFLSSGSVSWLYYSDRLVEFPLSILGLGLATVILPNLSKHYVDANAVAFSATVDWGLRLALVTGMPATIGLVVLAEPILSTLFQYDEFTAADVAKTALSLKAYAVGLLAYLFVKILLPAFTARMDLKTPVRFGMIAVCAALMLNVLAIPFAHAGLALATSLGAILNAALLLKRLINENVYWPEQGWIAFLIRIALSSIAMAVVLLYFVDIDGWSRWAFGNRIVQLSKWIAVGITVYILALMVLGLRIRHLTGTNDKIPAI